MTTIERTTYNADGSTTTDTVELDPETANIITIRQELSAAMEDLQAIVDMPALKVATVEDADAAIVELQAAVQEEAVAIRRIIRLLNEHLEGTD